MTPYTLNEIATIVNAKIIGDAQVQIHKIWFDTRHLTPQSKGIFFAIKGNQRDGASFLQEAYNLGIRNFVVTEVPQKLENANYLIVSDVVSALQKWAAYHRQKFIGQVIGITGTHGKTIVKEWLYQLLYQKLKIVRSPQSYNSQIGVPLSILEMESEADIYAIELGISKPNEMGKIAKIVQPDIAVITMVGNAHSEFFRDKLHQIHEKMKMAEYSSKIILPYDEEALRQYAENNFQNKTIITFGRSNKSNIQLLSDWNDANMTVKFDDKLYHIQLPFTDEASIYNALVCFALASQLPVNLEELNHTFTTLQAVEMRLEQKEGIHNNIIIDDTYNSDLSSIPIALNVLKNHIYPKKTLILTDVLQDRLKGQELYQKVANWVNIYPISKVILIGDEIHRHKNLFKNLYSAYPDTASFLTNIQKNDFHNEVILLKGARKFGLEKISKIFQEKSHDTVLQIDLGNLIHNIKYLKTFLKPQTQIMGMVKADGYGIGAVEVAQALISQGVEYFGVAYADEGAGLRENGITQSIVVMNPEQNSYDKMIQYHLEPEIYGFRMLNNFTEALIHHKIQTAYPVHVKLNTGMNRLGFDKNQISELVRQLADNPYIKVKSVFSHFATSDMSCEADFVNQQAKLFDEMYQKLSFNLGYQPIRHICNTAGIMHYSQYQMEMVRVGIGMYGISPIEENQKFLKNVVTFKTVISQIREIEAGQTVSYARNFRANKKVRIATLPVGYADGVKRILSNGKGEVTINGKNAKIIGNICMDMLMVDVSEISCAEGDEVMIFGENPTINQVAAWASTIPYEILTSISSRVKRIYVRNG